VSAFGADKPTGGIAASAPPQASGPLCTPQMLLRCRAYCCHIGFQLTDEEARAGFAKWHPDFPYHILQVGREGRCVHLDPETLRCQIYENRPQACRNFDCRKLPKPPR